MILIADICTPLGHGQKGLKEQQKGAWFKLSYSPNLNYF